MIFLAEEMEASPEKSSQSSVDLPSEAQAFFRFLERAPRELLVQSLAYYDLPQLISLFSTCDDRRKALRFMSEAAYERFCGNRASYIRSWLAERRPDPAASVFGADNVLSYAARRGSVPFVEALLWYAEDWPDWRRYKSVWIDAAIKAALDAGRKNVLDFFMDRTNGPDIVLDSALKRRKYVDYIPYILQQGANPKGPKNNGAPLSVALDYDNPKAARLLVEAGARPNDVLWENAVRRLHVPFVRLFQRVGPPPSDPTRLLHLAIAAIEEREDSEPALEVAKLLLTAGADPNRQVNGRTALQYARQKGEGAIYRLLGGKSERTPRRFR